MAVHATNALQTWRASTNLHVRQARRRGLCESEGEGLRPLTILPVEGCLLNREACHTKSWNPAQCSPGELVSLCRRRTPLRGRRQTTFAKRQTCCRRHFCVKGSLAAVCGLKTSSGSCQWLAHLFFAAKGVSALAMASFLPVSAPDLIVSIEKL